MLYNARQYRIVEWFCKRHDRIMFTPEYKGKFGIWWALDDNSEYNYNDAEKKIKVDNEKRKLAAGFITKIHNVDV